MIGSVLLMTLAQGAAPAALKPAGSWTLDERAGCTLSRRFASDAGEVTFGITPNVGAPGGELVLVLPGRASGRYEVDEGRIVLDGAERPFPAVWSRVGRRDQSFNGVTIQPSDGFWRALPAAKSLTVDVGKREKVSFDLGPMGAATAALDKCRADKAAQVASRRR
ncbi:MAG TPA: hypothetical protein VF636_08685 [Sphingomonas sp.]|jgi:hypothetical protein